MSEAITDTGPILHLNEIGRLELLSIFNQLIMPERVAEELKTFGLESDNLGVANLNVIISTVQEREWKLVINNPNQPLIHPADAQVFVLAQSNQFQKPILTDDLALRRRLENQQATVVGTVGVLIRAYTLKQFQRNELENAIEALITTSTLHINPAFRTYIQHLITNIP
jgi:predicted nucleic acid-binding protein